MLATSEMLVKMQFRLIKLILSKKPKHLIQTLYILWMYYIGLDYFAMLSPSDPIENQSETNARWQLEQI